MLDDKDLVTGDEQSLERGLVEVLQHAPLLLLQSCLRLLHVLQTPGSGRGTMRTPSCRTSQWQCHRGTGFQSFICALHATSCMRLYLLEK